MNKSSQETFEQAILDNPEDLSIRLIYADWLEEQGRTGDAEFLRLDCELQQMTGEEDDYATREKRWLELWYDMDDDWLEKLFGKGTFEEEAKLLVSHIGVPIQRQVIHARTILPFAGLDGELRIGELTVFFQQKFTISEATLADFFIKNRRSHAVQDLFRPEDHGLICLSTDQMQEIFRRPDGWNRFCQRFPESSGTIDFSRVGFNHAADQALLYWGQLSAPLMGMGIYYLFTKKDGKWHPTGSTMAWIS